MGLKKFKLNRSLRKSRNITKVIYMGGRQKTTLFMGLGEITREQEKDKEKKKGKKKKGKK